MCRVTCLATTGDLRVGNRIQLTRFLCRQIRQGIASNTKGTAFVVYEDVMDAKAACDKLNGFNFQNRYLVVLYHQIERSQKAMQNRAEQELVERQENLEKLKRENGIE